MENKPAIKNDVKTLLQTEKAKEQFNNILGKNSSSFMASVVQLSNKPELMECEPKSIISAAIIAASLNLSVDSNLGQAAIVPYKSKTGGNIAQLQIMYKGFIQLALRSGQIQTINAIEVHEGDIIRNNILTGEIIFSENQNFDKQIIGYASYIRLINGFEKMIYLPKTEIEKHAKRYSKTFSKYGTGLWKDDFDKMAQKTVLKMILSKYAPLSTEIQNAIKFDAKSIKITDNFDLNETEIDNDCNDFEIESKNLDLPKQNLFKDENNK